MTEIVGLLLATLIGISLGLIGGGGSILTVPVLVMVMKVDTLLATAYSLFIVGATSLVGAAQYTMRKLVDFRTAFVFGIPSIVAVYSTRKWLVPAIPENVFQIGDFAVTKKVFVMLLFALLMVLAAFSMIKKKKKITDPALDEDVFANADQKSHATSSTKKYNYPLILLEGLVVGTLTGIVGAGGGFLIIPALVLFAGLEMKVAIGTSLLIIAMKSLFGFTGDLGHFEMDWPLLLKFTAAAIVGIFIGNRLSKKVSSEKLKPAFGYFVLVMGFYIILNEIYRR